MSLRRNTIKVALPIGRAARLSTQIEALRFECCQAAERISNQPVLDEMSELELEECARLDDALAASHRILKSTLSQIIYSRLKRRSRVK